MPPRSHQPVQEPSQHSILLNIARRAHIFLTPDQQPYATVPLTGNTVPLYSATFRTWLSQAFEERGFLPSASQFGTVLRKLDEDAHNGNTPQLTVHLRTACHGNHSYRIDLDNLQNEAVEINGKQWSTTYNENCRFTRPQSAFSLPKPAETKAEIHKFLMPMFNITEPNAQMLVSWLVSALLPDLKPPILVITGTASDEGAAKLRSLIDPVTCPINVLPTTKNQFAQAAINNKVLVFQLDASPTNNCKAALNRLRKGMSVNLKEASRSRAPIAALIHRPIIISAEEPIKLHTSQLHIEINETRDVVHEQILGSLLDAVVRGIHEMTRRPAPVILEENEVLPSHPGQAPQMPAPYS